MKIAMMLLVCISSTVFPVFAARAGSESDPGGSRSAAALGQVPTGLSSADWQGIREAYESGRYAAYQQKGGLLRARNPAQQWTAEFDGRGFLVRPDHGLWTWGLKLQSIGFSDAPTALTGNPVMSQDGGQVSYRWSETLDEWFLNDTRGLEQGWTIRERPKSGRPHPGQELDEASPSSRLVLTLGVVGELVPVIARGGRRVAFRTRENTSALNYGGLKAWVATGRLLPVPKDDRILIDGEEWGAASPLRTPVSSGGLPENSVNKKEIRKP